MPPLALMSFTASLEPAIAAPATEAIGPVCGMLAYTRKGREGSSLSDAPRLRDVVDELLQPAITRAAAIPAIASAARGRFDPDDVSIVASSLKTRAEVYIIRTFWISNDEIVFTH